jgi:uncharacterized protein (DUF3084 family)
MRRTPTLAAVTLALFVVGCGEEKAALPKAFLSLLNETADALATIKDVDSAKAASPKLKELADRKKKLDEQAQAMKVSKSEMQSLDAEYAPKMKEAGQRLTTEIMRIATTSPEAAEIVADIMK